jgi:hypothetical protein
MIFLAFGQKIGEKPAEMPEGIECQSCGDGFVVYLHESLRPLSSFQIIGLSTLVSPFTEFHEQFCGVVKGFSPSPDWIVFET